MCQHYTELKNISLVTISNLFSNLIDTKISLKTSTANTGPVKTDHWRSALGFDPPRQHGGSARRIALKLMKWNQV